MDWKSPRFGSQLEVFESKQRKERLTQWMLHSNVVNEMFYTISKSRIFMGGSSIIPSHGRFMAARVSHYSFILGRRRMRRRKKKRKRMMRRTVRRKKTWICWRWFCYFSMGNPLLGESIGHDGSMVLLYMVTWIPSIYPLYVSIYTSTMDPMAREYVFNCFWIPFILMFTIHVTIHKTIRETYG